MKIVIFDGSFKTTTFINNLILGLSSKNEVYVLGFNENLEEKITGVKYVPLGTNDSLYRFVKTSLIYSIRGKYLFCFVKLFFQKGRKRIQKLNLDYQLNQINPDIIHVQWLSHISWFEGYLKYSNYHFALSLRGYQINVLPYVSMKSKNYLQDWILYFDGIHGVSNAIMQNLEALNIKRKKSVTKVIYSGHTIPDLRKTKKSWGLKSVPEFLLVGRNHWKKNYTLILRYAKFLKEQNIQCKFRFVGFNQGDSEEFLFISDKLEIDKYIEFLPRQNSNELSHLYRSSDALILPSLEEGIANVCIEAMSYRLPVISSNIGGMTELISHLESGILIKNLNLEGLHNSISLFLSISEKKRENMVNKGYEIVKSKFNSKLMVEGFNRFYQEIVKG